jgi:hypothetical protein
MNSSGIRRNPFWSPAAVVLGADYSQGLTRQSFKTAVYMVLELPGAGKIVDAAKRESGSGVTRRATRAKSTLCILSWGYTL